MQLRIQEYNERDIQMRSNRGFTLIELLIVISILALLAIIAAPAYQKYVLRSQVAGVHAKHVCDWNLSDLELLASGIDVGQAYSTRRITDNAPAPSLFIMMTKKGLQAATTSALATTVTFGSVEIGAVLATIQGYCAARDEIPRLHGFAVEQVSETFEILLSDDGYRAQLSPRD